MQSLTVPNLKREAGEFALWLSTQGIPELYGVTDGKAVGTYVEHALRDELATKYNFEEGSSASGIDFPGIGVDMKVTSVRQPQSSCPFKSAADKVYGLGYHLMVFVYDKSDREDDQVAQLLITAAVFIDKQHTSDYQTTRGLLDILDREGNQDDVAAFLEERSLPVDDVGRRELAKRILTERPSLGYVTVSNALQWRLQYSRVLTLAEAGGTEGIENLLIAGGGNGHQ